MRNEEPRSEELETGNVGYALRGNALMQKRVGRIALMRQGMFDVSCTCAIMIYIKYIHQRNDDDAPHADLF